MAMHRNGVSVRYRIRWDRVIVVVALCLVIVAMLAWAAAIYDRTGGLAPCPTEDSTGCYWDADTMGNGRGNDVIDLGVDGVVEVSP
jgi:hypothetical protein